MRTRLSVPAARLLATLAAASLGACVSDLSVGVVALENEDQGAGASDGGTVTAREDAGRPDSGRDGGRDAEGARDAGAPLDARVADARAPSDDRCDNEPCDGAIGGGSREDAAIGDASSGRDAHASEAGALCAPSECDIVGVRLNEMALCDDGTPMLCLRNQNGVCDYACD